MSTLIRTNGEQRLRCGNCRHESRWFREQGGLPFSLVQNFGNMQIMSQQGRTRPLEGVVYCSSCDAKFRQTAEVVEE